MGHELVLILLLRSQAAVSLAILVVFAARRPCRRLVGAELAYGLWALVPLAAASSLFPPLSDFLSGHSTDPSLDDALTLSTLLKANRVWSRHSKTALEAWTLGSAALGLTFIAGEALFRARARRGEAGPAIVGLASPRLVVPRDYRQRFDEAERSIIRAHERVHVEKSHLSWNAVGAVLQVIGWFNPLLHVAAAAARLDQELACDAAVLDGRSISKRAYAEVLLKASAGPRGPLACSLSSHGRELETRLRHIMRAPVSLKRYLLGLVAVGAAGAVLVGLVWCSEPAEGFGPPARYPEKSAAPVFLSLLRPAP